MSWERQKQARESEAKRMKDTWKYRQTCRRCGWHWQSDTKTKGCFRCYSRDLETVETP